jgi:hypothetical protein
MYAFGFFVKFRKDIIVWACFWVFYSIPLIYVSVFVLVPYCICYHYITQYNLKSDIVMPLALLFLFSNTLAIQRLLWIHIKFSINSSIFCEEWHWNCIVIALNLQIAFSSIYIFTILILLIHEHGVSFHFLVSFSILH